MSEFSNLLTDLIQTQNINVASLTRYCGLDRSTMYKLINGKRSPSSRELVQKIAEFIHLNPWERQQLMESYEITRLGSEIYYQRKAIQRFILNLKEIQKTSLPPSADFPEELPPTASEAVPLTGKVQVSAAVHSIFRRAAASATGGIGILAQPDHLETLDIVPSLVQASKNLKIDHIICLNNTKQSIPFKHNYNLQGLSKIIPFYGTRCKYQPYYYYDNIVSHFGSFNLMTCLFLTETEVVLCNSDLSGGFFLHSAQMTAPLRQHFQRLLSMAFPMVLSFDSSLEFHFKKLPELFSADRDAYSLSYEPCLSPCVSPEFLDKYLAPAFKQRGDFLDQLQTYFQTGSWSHNFFSETGLTQFAKTGRLHEIPPELYAPIEPSDRIRLLRKYIRLLDSGLDIRMYRGALSSFPSNFHMLSAANFGYLMFISQSSYYSYLILEEPNLLNAFFDFASSLEETDLLASVQETRSCLQNTLNVLGG